MSGAAVPDLMLVRIAVALAAGLLLEVSAHAGDVEILNSRDDIHTEILNLTKGYYRAWSYTRGSEVFDRAGRYYSSDPNNVYWDPMPPLEGFRGWGEYRNVVETVWIPGGIAAAGILFASDGSFRAWRHGDVVWTTGNCIVRVEMEAGATATNPCRGLQVWERHGEGWVIAHEIFSAPVHPGTGLFQAPRKADERVRPDPEFTRLSREIARSWGDGPVAEAAGRLRPYYGPDETLHLYMPWAPHDGYPDWESLEEGLRGYLALGIETLRIRPNNDVEVTRRGDIAWSHGTVHFEFTDTSGEVLAADGRQSRIWLRQGDAWVVVNEHLAIPMSH